MFNLWKPEDELDNITSGDADWWSYDPFDDLEEYDVEKLGEVNPQAKALVDELFEPPVNPDITIRQEDTVEAIVDGLRDFGVDADACIVGECKHAAEQELKLLRHCNTLYQDHDFRTTETFDTLHNMLKEVDGLHMVILPTCAYFVYLETIFKIDISMFYPQFIITKPKASDIPELVYELLVS